MLVGNQDVACGGLGVSGELGCGTENQTRLVAVGNWGVMLVGTRQEGWVVVWNWGVALGTRHDIWVDVGNRGVAFGARHENWMVVGNWDVALGTRQVGW